MKLLRLTIENLGPFYGKHTIDLTVTQPGNVILIHGENMRGKTSTLNAIRWCLYGRALGRAGHGKDTYRLINWDALQAGDYHMTVQLEFDHDNATYQLERHVEATVRPHSDRDLSEPTVDLRIGGKRQDSSAIPRIIGNILHKDISRFFLFDGEMLDEYEALLRHPDKETDLVKDSIEQILGLPSLELAEIDLEAQREHAQKRQLKAVKQSQRNEQMVADASQLEEGLAAIGEEINKLQQLKREKEVERDLLQDQRQQFIEVQSDLRALDELELELVNSQGLQASLREEIRAHLHNAWWLAASTLGAEELQKAQQRVQEATEARERLGRLQRDRELIAKTLGSGSCEVCGQPVVASSAKSILESQFAAIESEIATVSGQAVDLAEPVARMKLLQPFADTGDLRALREKEAAYVRLKIDQRRHESRKQEIRERLKDHDRVEIKRTERAYEECLGILQRLSSEISDADKAREIKREEVARLRKEIERLPEADPWLATEAALYEALEALFERAIEGFRERLRIEVAKEATNIFRILTTEKEYAELRINERYGLTIVDTSGRSILDRSAGAEQVVALSLIGALNRCALREGPVVMDTPFGRLDLRHREKILRFMPTLGPQVILLVQSGEINRDRDLGYLDGHVGHEYRIERDGAPTRSRIERV
jgi:DNA sulfur modification protein DndD